MDRSEPSSLFNSSLPGQVNGGFHLTDESVVKSSSSAGKREVIRGATEDRLRAFQDSERCRKGNSVSWTDAEECHADPSILSALERTLAAFLNQGLLLVGIGTGLMTFGHDGPRVLGGVLVPTGVLHIIWSWCEFYIRVRRMRNGSDNSLSFRRSLVWTGTLVLLIVVASIIELFFNISLGAFVRVTFPDTNGQGVSSTTTHP